MNRRVSRAVRALHVRPLLSSNDTTFSFEAEIAVIKAVDPAAHRIDLRSAIEQRFHRPDCHASPRSQAA